MRELDGEDRCSQHAMIWARPPYGGMNASIARRLAKLTSGDVSKWIVIRLEVRNWIALLSPFSLRSLAPT
jgi:hypothetical protein